jgi:hypothetical protein
MKKQYKEILRESVGAAWTYLFGSGQGEHRRTPVRAVMKTQDL